MSSPHSPVNPRSIDTNARCFTLRNEITALRLCRPPKARYDSAVLSELPKGAALIVCGAGFNHRTIRVNWQNDSYYVFERDLVEGE